MSDTHDFRPSIIEPMVRSMIHEEARDRMGDPIQTLSTLDAARVAQGFISFTQWALTRSRQGRWLREHEPEAMLHRLQAIDDCSRFIHALALAHEQGRAPEGVQDCVTFVLQTCCDVWSWIESTAASA